MGQTSYDKIDNAWALSSLIVRQWQSGNRHGEMRRIEANRVQTQSFVTKEPGTKRVRTHRFTKGKSLRWQIEIFARIHERLWVPSGISLGGRHDDGCITLWRSLLVVERNKDKFEREAGNEAC